MAAKKLQGDIKYTRAIYGQKNESSLTVITKLVVVVGVEVVTDPFSINSIVEGALIDFNGPSLLLFVSPLDQ